MDKRYLGDGVYVNRVNGMLKVTSENGVEELHAIYLETEVMEGLVQYAKEAGVLPNA